MAHNNLTSLQVQVDAGIAHVTLKHPPINLFDDAMSKDLDQITRELERGTQVRVVILQSAIAKSFIALSGLARVAAGPEDVSQV